MSYIHQQISRRLLLKRASQLGFMGAAAPLALNLASIGEAAAAEGGDEYRALVCLFLYGGNDHANTLVPYDRVNYSRYLAIRGGVAFQRRDLAATALAPRV